jgi:hypothetical protein
MRTALAVVFFALALGLTTGCDSPKGGTEGNVIAPPNPVPQPGADKKGRIPKGPPKQ